MRWRTMEVNLLTIYAWSTEDKGHPQSSSKFTNTWRNAQLMIESVDPFLEMKYKGKDPCFTPTDFQQNKLHL